MKTLLICISIHHGSTKKIAKTMAKVLDAEVLEPANIDVSSLDKYELIGFGSGIYGWKHHKSLLTLIDKLRLTNNSNSRKTGCLKQYFLHRNPGFSLNKCLFDYWFFAIFGCWSASITTYK